MRFNAAKRQCSAFTSPFPLWTKKEQRKHKGQCFSRQVTAEAYKKEQEQILHYGHEASNTSSKHIQSVEKEIKRADALIAADINDSQGENQRTGFPWIYAMGGSSNKDGSMFGKESAKDNRMMHRKRDPKREDWN
jgi:hypothetical protein